MSASHRQRLLYSGVLVALLSVIVVLYTRLAAPSQPLLISPLLLTPHPIWKSGKPTLWVLRLGDGSQPKILMSKENVDFGGVRWSADGNYIYYLSSNLWKVAVEDGTTQSLTTGMDILGYRFLPGQPWIYLTDIRLYETPSNDSPGYYSIWLLNSEDGTLRRLTTEEEDWIPFTHSPDGTSLLVTRNGVEPHLFSLVDGSLTSVEERIGPGSIYIISGNRIY